MNFSSVFSRRFGLLSVVLTGLFAISILINSTASAEIDPDTIVGMWLFDEGKGNAATDETGNGLDGEFEGKPKWVNGKFGKGLELDGAEAHIVIPAHENPTKAITVSIWAKSHTDTWNSTVSFLRNGTPISSIPTKAQKMFPGPFAMAAVGISPAAGAMARLVLMILPNGTCTRLLMIARPVSGTSILMEKKRARWI